MSDRPSKIDGPGGHDGEDLQTDALAPEHQNSEQDERAEQAQDLAGEAGRSAGQFPTDRSDKAPSGEVSVEAEDVVDHMKQMVTSGRIDNSAYRGEPNLDDNEDKYGPGSKVDDLPSDGS